jgi:hypothetical protein
LDRLLDLALGLCSLRLDRPESSLRTLEALGLVAFRFLQVAAVHFVNRVCE